MLFARPAFYRFNKVITRLGLSGLGILNYENLRVSGEEHFMRSILPLPRHSVVVDVGANTGDYSLALSRLAPDIDVYAFEPHPVTYNTLKRHASPQVHCYNAALGDSVGAIELYDYKDSTGSSHASLFRDVIEKIHRKPSRSYPVQVTTLDSVIKENAIKRVGLLKIDTEGNELAVLRGGAESIAAGMIDVIQLEFNEMHVTSRTFFRDIWDALPTYRLYRLLPHGLLPIPEYTALFCELFAYQNIVAIMDRRP
jgi:FkbM family methyltransferase